MNTTRIKGILAQNFFHLRHSLEDIVDTFFWPSMDVIIWGFLTIYFTGLGGPVVGVITFLMGGLILWNIVWRAQQDISIAFLRNVWSRNTINLFSSPLTVWEFIIASMVTGLFKIILTLSLVSLLAFYLYSFNIFSLGFYLLPFFVNLIAFAWTIGVIITALIIYFGNRIQSFAWSLIVLFNPVSAVFYPISVLPSLLQKIAWFLPTAHIFEGMREVLRNGFMSGEHLLWASTFNAIYIFVACVFFAFMFKKAREKGKLAKADI